MESENVGKLERERLILRLRNIVSAPQSTAASFVRREFKRHLFVVGTLDKQMQNEKELIRLASAGVGGLFCICVESINLI